MNIKKIVVDKVPENCIMCPFAATDFEDDPVCAAIPLEEFLPIDLDSSTRPSWCPLETEEVCEWQIKPSIAKWHGEPMHDIVKQCDPDSFYSAVIDKDKEAKCNCGKRIKYVEVE